MSLRNELIQIITTDPNYKNICRVLNKNNSEDLFQEISVELLTMPEERLPKKKNELNWWFYCIARNMSSKTGKVGLMFKEVKTDNEEFKTAEFSKEKLIREAENFMLSLNEFENRIVLLFCEHQNMKKIQKLTGISYSALRTVKDKIKLKAKSV